MKYKKQSQWNKTFRFTVLILMFFVCFYAEGQSSDGISCIVSVGNSNAPLSPNGEYLVLNVPSDLGAIRARATCSNGSVGQSHVGFTIPVQDAVIDLGPIEFGQMSPVPVAAELDAPTNELNSNESVQVSVTAIHADGTSRDVTQRSEGTIYSISNDLLGQVSENGMVSIAADFDVGSSAKLLVGAITEGSASSTLSFTLGPKGKLSGRVFNADGVTPVSNAQVSVQRLQPNELEGTVQSDANGKFNITDVNAGLFRVLAIDPVSGEQAFAYAAIQSEGQTVDLSLVLSGQGNVKVTVLSDSGQVVPGAELTITSLGTQYVVKNGITDTNGEHVFSNLPADQFTVSSYDSATNLFGSAFGKVSVDNDIEVSIKLQKTGSISGVVLDVDGTTPVENVQVRVSSRSKGVVSQLVTPVDGSFVFDTLAQSDGPFILDAFIDGRLRGRVPGLVFTNVNDLLTQNIVLNSVGVIKGKVLDAGGNSYANATVSVQSLVGEHLSFSASTDDSGRFVLPAVPVGAFKLTATTQLGRAGKAEGQISYDGETLETDVMLSSNTLVGTVYERDGVTPVEAGVIVYLADRRLGEFYSYEGHQGVVVTTTNEEGKFGFVLTEPGDFYVQAENNLDRGRGQVVAVNLDPINPYEVDIQYLAKGSVYGVVKDADGQVRENVSIEIYSEGVFEAKREVKTDQNGYYLLDGVFAGNLVLKAIDHVSNESAVRYARLDAEGESVEVNVILSASGTIQGRILDWDRSLIQHPVNLKIWVDDIPYFEVDLIDGSEYRVEHIPVGEVTLIAETLQTKNKGVALTRIDFQDDLRNVDIQLIGQGSIEIRLTDENGDPVSDATVQVNNEQPFEANQQLVSNESGIVLFESVNAGDFNVTATKRKPFGALQGSYSGTLLPNETRQLLVQMETVAVGSISGVLYKSDGVTPVPAGWVVRMLPEPFTDAYVTTTDSAGYYEFPSVNAGTYDITAMKFFGELERCPTRDRNRAGAFGVELISQGENVTANLQLIGSGTVFGKVTDADGLPVGNIKVTLTNPDLFFGANVTCLRRTTYETITDANGQYRLLDIPPGNFTLLAENVAGTRRSEGAGRVSFDGDEVEVNLSLIDSAVTMPYDFYDANGFLYDINGDGSIANGTRNVYATDTSDTGGMLLEIVTNGVPVPFVNGDGSIGQLSADGQEVIVDDSTPSGLFVTRKIRTPRSGYFTRYLEILFNPTENPIEVDVRVKSHHRTAEGSPRVVDSSDGDQVLSIISPTNPDRWVVLDDQIDVDPFIRESIAASAHVFDGYNGLDSVDSAQYELIGSVGRLTYQWENIVIEPGQKIALMHFALGQIGRDTARVATNRILSIPPEVIEDITSDEKSAIINFSIPEDSSVDPLPNLRAGRVTGFVLSGSGANKVANADVEFVSLHPLFKRIRHVKSDAQGLFVFETTLDGTENNSVIPVFDFNLLAKYSLSGATTATAFGGFETGKTEAEKDLIFIGTGDIRGNVIRHYGAFVANAKVILCDVMSINKCLASPSEVKNQTVSGVDGSYELFANPPGDYVLAVALQHPQGGANARPLQGQGEATVTPTDVVVADLIMENTGTVSGVIRSSDGIAVSNAKIQLFLLQNGAYQKIRETTGSTSGHYRFYDVPTGQLRIKAIDTISNSIGTADVVVNTDDEIDQDVVLTNSALLNLTVEFSRGVTASGSVITFFDGVEVQRKITDSNGLAQFLVQSGSYQVLVSHPDVPNERRPEHPLTKEVSIVIGDSDDTVNFTVRLDPAGDVMGTIVRPDGTTLAGGFPYKISQIQGPAIPVITGVTSDTGSYRNNGLPLGEYIITAYDSEQDRFADSTFFISTDGQEKVIDLTLLDERVALPANLVDANRFIYDIQQNGSMAQGSKSFSNAASELRVNGELFVGDTSARLQAGKRQFAITQPTSVQGLMVTRKTYVPRGGYFVRYIEEFKNASAQDIIVDVELFHSYSVGEVVNTSDGDITISESDQWFIVDDQTDDDIMLYPRQMPAVAHVFAGYTSTLNPSDIALSYVDLKPRVKQSWTQITVPAGTTRSLMHVMVQQINRLGSETAADRLSKMPPELLTDLTPADIAAIMNFNIPTDGLSTLEALPPLTGSVNGTVYEGNESTQVPKTRVTVQSKHPLFSRTWGMKKNDDTRCHGGTVVDSLHSSQEDAIFELQGQLTETDSIAIPSGVDIVVSAQVAQSCYGEHSGHPFTNVPSRVVSLEASGQQNVIFDTGVFTGTTIGTIDHAIISGRVYLSIDNTEEPDYQYTTIKEDGTYIYPGVLPGSYDLLFDTKHPNGVDSDVLRGSKKAVNIQASQVLVSDISLQPSGSIQGAVVAFDGAPSQGAEVILTGQAENQIYDQCNTGCVANALDMHKGKRLVSRRVNTDSLGRYNLSAVPEGVYELQVIDPVSSGITTNTVSVSANQITTQNIILTAVGSATVTVLDVQNSPVINAVVYANTVAPGGFVAVGRTDYNGQFTVANIPVGAYELKITDPRAPTVGYFNSLVTGQIVSSGQNNNHSVKLKTKSSVSLSVINSDSGGQPVSNAAVTITDASGTRSIGQTDDHGRIDIHHIPLGAFSITATAIIGGIEKQESVNGTVSEADNDLVKSLQIDLKTNFVYLPIQIKDANNNRYFMNQDDSGKNAPYLLIDGTPFLASSEASVQLDNRQYVMTSNSMYSGLTIKRKAFVPLNGYFLRYQEILENNNDFDITVNLTVSNQLIQGPVRTTSNGDDVIQNTGSDRDLWYVSKQSYNDYSAFLGSDGKLPPELSHQGINQYVSRSDLLWNNLTIPANSRVQFLHFFVRQTTEEAAAESMRRLVQIPPEILTGLSTNDVDEIQNFNLPVDLQSQLTELPSLSGQISGHVYEGDSTTPAVDVNVSIEHDHPLYPGIIDGTDVDSLKTDSNGAFSITGLLSIEQNSRVIPLGSQFTITANRSPNRQVVLTTEHPFGQNSIDVDLVFNTGSIQGLLTGAYRYQGNEHLSVTALQNGKYIKHGEVQSTFDYQITGLDAGVYDIQAQLGDTNSHLKGYGNGITVTQGTTLNLDIDFEPNGAVAGEVTSSTGVQLPNQTVKLTQTGTDFERTTKTDASGQYVLGAIPVGDYIVTAISSETAAQTTASIQVMENQSTIQDLTIVGVGNVTVTTRYQTGVTAGNLSVYITSDVIPNSTLLGRTDSNGILEAEIPVGSYTLYANNPNTGQQAIAQGVVSFEGESSSLDLLLPASASVQFNILDGNSGNTPIQNATIEVRELNSSSNTTLTGNSNANGEIHFTPLKQLSYRVLVKFNDLYQTTFVFKILPSMDGQQVVKNVILNESHHQTDSFNYSGQSLLHQVEITAGQFLSIDSRTLPDGSGPARTSDIKVFGPTGNLLAEGRVYPSNITTTTNDIRLIPVETYGRYTIQSATYSGSQFISASVDGESLPVEAYTTGGSVIGHLNEIDSSNNTTPISNGSIRIQSLSSSGPVLDVKTETDSTGLYGFSGVPLGDVKATYEDRSDVFGTATIQTQGEQVTIDLTATQESTFNIRVLKADGTLIGQRVQLRIDTPSQPVIRPYTNTLGEYTYKYLNDSGIVTFQVTSPYDSQIKAIQRIEATGDTVNVDLILDSVSAQGVVYDADGVTSIANSVVTIYYAHGGYITQATTDTEGRYSVSNLPVNILLRFTVTDPINSVKSSVDVLSEQGVNIDQDIVFVGKGAVYGNIQGIGDIPAAHLTVTASYVSDLNNGWSNGSINMTTDIDGNYRIEGVPVGREITVSYYDYRNYAVLSDSVTTSLTAHGDSEQIDFQVTGSSVRLRLNAADGLPIADRCYLNLITESDSGGEAGFGYWTSSVQACDQPFHVVGIPGGQNITIELYNAETNGRVYTNQWALTTDRLIDEQAILSVITGAVRYANGTTVAHAQLSSNNGSTTTANQSGQYRMLGIGQGPFVINASDATTGLSGQASATLIDESIPQTLDIQLQPSAAISGTVYDPLGNPMANITVHAENTVAKFTVQDSTDAAGVYELPHIALGQVDLSAANTGTNNVTTESTYLTSDGETQNINLYFLKTASVTGSLNDSQGNSVSAGCVRLQHTHAHQAYGYVYHSTSSDATGSYSFDSVAPGQVLIYGAEGECYDNGSFSISKTDVLSDTPLTENLQTGNAVKLYTYLNDGGNRYKLGVDNGGAVAPMNNSSSGIDNNMPFIQHLGLSVNGRALKTQVAAFKQVDNQQLLVGPTTTDLIAFERQVYSGTDGDFARIADKVTNTGTEAITVEVKLSGKYGKPQTMNQESDPSKVLLPVDPVQNGGTHAIHQYDGNQNTDPAVVGYVFSGNTPLIPVDTDFKTGRSEFSWSWSYTIQPGETAIFLSYLVYSDPDDISTVSGLLNELLNGTKTDMFTEMSTADLNQVVNFQVP